MSRSLLLVFLWEFAVLETVKGQGALKCEEGFKIDTTGKSFSSCVDIDECSMGMEEKCHVLAYCKNTEGSFQCVCQPGMYGDGFNCRSHAYAVRAVISVNGSLAEFEKGWDAVKSLYGDLLIWGGVPVMERAMIEKSPRKSPSMPDAGSLLANRTQLVDTTHKTAEFNPVFNTTTVTMHALFGDKTTAEAAVRKVIGHQAFGHYSFDHLFSRVLALPVSLIDPPKVFAWQAGTSSDPNRINPSGFNVENVYFVRSCMKGEGCWVVDVSFATGTANTISVIYISRVSAQDQQRLSRETKATFQQRNFPCSPEFDPAKITRAATVCCLWDFVSRYRAIEGFEKWVLESAALRKACNSSSDGVKAAPKSSILKGLPDFTSGTFENMTFSKVIDRGLIGMHGDMRAARILLHQSELRAMVGLMSDGVGQKSKADCFVGIAHFTPTGIKILDGAGHQKRLALDRFDKNTFIAIDHSQRMEIDSKPWFSVEGSSEAEEPEDAGEESAEEEEDVGSEHQRRGGGGGEEGGSNDKSEL